MFHRASVVALVSKSWNEAERAAALQPTDLAFDRHNYSLSALKWQFRDTKLQTVRFPGEWGMGASASALAHLAAKAPALRLLDVSPPILAYRFGFLQLLGGLTQVEELTIHEWQYTPDEILSFRSLASLQKLQVPPASFLPPGGPLVRRTTTDISVFPPPGCSLVKRATTDIGIRGARY